LQSYDWFKVEGIPPALRPGCRCLPPLSIVNYHLSINFTNPDSVGYLDFEKSHSVGSATSSAYFHQKPDFPNPCPYKRPRILSHPPWRTSRLLPDTGID